MEFTDQGLILEREEAENLASILGLSASMMDWNRNMKEMWATKKIIYAALQPPKSPEYNNQITVTREYLPLFATVGKFAVANPDRLLEEFCRPSAFACGSYLPWLEQPGQEALDNVKALIKHQDGMPDVVFPE